MGNDDTYSKIDHLLWYISFFCYSSHTLVLLHGTRTFNMTQGLGHVRSATFICMVGMEDQNRIGTSRDKSSES